MKLRYTLTFEVSIDAPYHGKSGLVTYNAALAVIHEQSLLDSGDIAVEDVVSHIAPVSVVVTPVLHPENTKG